MNKSKANGRILGMELIEIKEGHKALEDIKNLYLRAFPKSERKDFNLILKNVTLGKMKILAAYDGKFIGEAILMLDGDIVLLDYLAISDEVRGGGYGSKILAELLKLYDKERLILEIESTLDDDDPIKHRRKNFYLRNGFKLLDYEVVLFGVRMQLMSDGSMVSFEEYFNVYKHLFNALDLSRIKLLEK